MELGTLALLAAGSWGLWKLLKPGTAVARLSDDAVAELLYRVGWRGKHLVNLETAVRIVLGESGGNPAATNKNKNGTIDRGLFQLNSAAFKDIAPVDAFDPAKNALRAFKSYEKAGGFVPGKSAWWGKTKFHTLKRDPTTGAMVPDADRIKRARLAVARLLARKGLEAVNAALV